MWKKAKKEIEYCEAALECGILSPLLALVKSSVAIPTITLINALWASCYLLIHIIQKLPIEFMKELLASLLTILDDQEHELVLSATAGCLALIALSEKMIPIVVEMGICLKNVKNKKFLVSYLFFVM